MSLTFYHQSIFTHGQYRRSVVYTTPELA